MRHHEIRDFVPRLSHSLCLAYRKAFIFGVYILGACGAFAAMSLFAAAQQDDANRAAAVYELRSWIVNADREALEARSKTMGPSIEGEMVRAALDVNADDASAARRHLDTAVALAKDTDGGMPRVEAQVRVQRARVLSIQGDYTGALDDLLQAKTAYLDTPASSGNDRAQTIASPSQDEAQAVADIELMLCSTHGALENFEAATQACTRALDAVAGIEDDFIELRALNSRAVLGMRSQNYAAAERDYLEALDIARARADNYSEIHILGNLSTVARHLGKANEAVAFAEAGLSRAQSIDVAYLVAHQRTILADALLYAGRIDEAAGNIEQVMDVLSAPRFRQYALEIASAIASAQGDHRGAQDFRIQASSLQRDIAGERRATESLRLQEEFAAKQREQRIQSLQIAANLGAAQLRFQLYFTVAAVVVATALALLTLLIWRNRQVESQRRLIEGRLLERQRMAGELHDTLLQDVFGMSYLLSAIARSRNTPDAIRTDIERVLDIADSAVVDTRHAVAAMRGEVEDISLEEAFESITDRALQSPLSDARLDVRIDSDLPGVLEPVRNACTGILREALANAAKHANASRVEVEVTSGDQSLNLTVRDDGVGYDTTQSHKGHWGINMMREKAKRAGGKLRIHSRPGQGCTVTASFPTLHQGR